MKFNYKFLFLLLALATGRVFGAVTIEVDTSHNMHAVTDHATDAHVQNTPGEAHAVAAAHSNDAHGADHAAFDPASTAIHHISDANVYTILDAVTIPLPMFLYSKDGGWDIFSSSKFHSGHHEDGHKAYNGYVLYHGSVHKVVDTTFPKGESNIDGYTHKTETKDDGKQIDVNYAIVGGKEYRLDSRSTLDGGVLGGGITSFYDFSLTKNVVSMILVCLFLFWVFRSAAKAYSAHPDKAPKGIQAILEPMFTFIRDEVAIPFIGKDKYMRFLPLLMSIFFFILGLNLFGQVPFFGGTNVTGNLTVTMIIALIVFVIVNINGKRDYWQHIFWMPNVPIFVKPLLAAVEIMGLFIKPLTLMLRLAGNITAGHIAILSFIGLIFIFGKSGASMGGSAIGTAMAVPLTLFMMAIELIVAFVQAFVFTILTASYIGAALEEHHHADHSDAKAHH
jgi:F-type H+-transporting ATPase subunit a